MQREIERRNGAHSGVRIFSGKIRCAECGSWFGSKVWHSNDKYRRVIWQCNHMRMKRNVDAINKKVKNLT